VVLPYDSREQVTSGVLVDAIAAGRSVIATAFPHARELLAETGVGLVVPHESPQAIADAINSVLATPSQLVAMEERARRMSSTLQWSSVADQYVELIHELLSLEDPVLLAISEPVA
jgi:polysaccharide biosynthesis protein PslF